MNENKKPDIVEERMDNGYEAMQIARILVEHFKEDFEAQTRDSSEAVRQRAYNLFFASIM